MSKTKNAQLSNIRTRTAANLEYGTKNQYIDTNIERNFVFFVNSEFLNFEETKLERLEKREKKQKDFLGQLASTKKNREECSSSEDCKSGVSSCENDKELIDKFLAGRPIDEHGNHHPDRI